MNCFSSTCRGAHDAVFFRNPYLDPVIKKRVFFANLFLVPQTPAEWENHKMEDLNMYINCDIQKLFSIIQGQKHTIQNPSRSSSFRYKLDIVDNH